MWRWKRARRVIEICVNLREGSEDARKNRRRLVGFWGGCKMDRSQER